MPNSQFTSFDDLDENNIVGYLDGLSQKCLSTEQTRWAESNIDVNFWAGNQDFVYQYFGFSPQGGFKKFFFNVIQQPCNLVTGYQRQHRKSYSAIPVHQADQLTADQLSEVIKFANAKEYLLETFSDACEQAVVSGLNMMMPYLNYEQDFMSGSLKWKIWEFNSFMCDPYFRDTASFSDLNYCWFQRYISRRGAMIQYPDHREMIQSMSGYGNQTGQFYFLPENYSIGRDDLLVVSHYWYKAFRNKKMLFNKKTGELSEFLDSDQNIRHYTQVFDHFEEVTRPVPTWRVATLINRTPIYVGPNPLGFDECPFVPVYWNLDNHIPQIALRNRSLVRSVRDMNFLFNRRIILNHQISEDTLNSGWIYEEDSVVNEETLGKSGTGENVIYKTGTKVAPYKIVPQAVPASDMQLADQLLALVPNLTGVNQELLGMTEEKGIAGITQMLRQGAGLVTLQKYFDQWDRSLKQLGVLTMKIIQKNWLPFKVQQILGAPPTEQFQTKNFQEFDILCAEGLNTTVQRQENFAQMLEFQQITGEKIPFKLLLEESTLPKKDKIAEALEQQQQQAAEREQEREILEMALLEGTLENQKANTIEKLAMAKERVGRTKSNVGLFEERISEVTQNRAKAVKEKVSALKELLDTIRMYGELKTKYGSIQLDNLDKSQQAEEQVEQIEGKEDSARELDASGIMKLLE